MFNIERKKKKKSSENSMGVYINFGCFVTGFKSWFKRNLSLCHKEEEEKKQ